ncbi:MAG: NTP transferase domain-containing protein [Desulfobacterales bacterium]|jgi:UDP-N-acetylglucosamine diphosphorylase/glucosamine-1-phosphate N-acetyltransferase
MHCTADNIAVIILAAGLGTRMHSNKAKVLHEILGKPMVLYVIETAQKVARGDIIVVIGTQGDKVREAVSKRENRLIFAYQDQQLGTGHAVLCALPHLSDHVGAVVILCGDVPLITAETVLKLIDSHVNNSRDITVLAVKMDDPTGYGRILTDQHGQVRGIVEEVDATEEQKKINTINTGIYCVNSRILADLLQKISPDNTQSEIYLTDIVALGYKANKSVGVFTGGNLTEFYGINNRQDLSKVQTLMRKRLGE